MNLGVLGLLGRYFFCDLLTYHFHISWHVFFFGVLFGFGPYQSFPPFLAMNQAWELLWGGSFCWFSNIIFYEVLLTSRWNPNARVNPLTKVAGLHWKYGSPGNFQQKWFLVYWLLQAALDLRKNMQAKNSTPKWRVAQPRIHPPPLFGVPKCELSTFWFGPFTPPSSDSSTATSRHEPCTRQLKPLGWYIPFIINPTETPYKYHVGILIGYINTLLKGGLQQGG